MFDEFDEEPLPWVNVADRSAAALKLAQAAAQHGVSLGVFYIDDVMIPIELENTLVLRISADRSTDINRSFEEIQIPRKEHLWFFAHLM